jgi:site-specific DNA-methyltransferase (adenine-specific)
VIADDLLPLEVPLDRLQLLPGNPRRGDVEAVARSLDKFGQRKPIVARKDGTVIAGNHTLQAARSLGWDGLAVVWVDEDDATSKAYSLADNRTAELGGYNDEELAALIGEVQAVDEELLAATAWTAGDLEDLLDKLGVDRQHIDDPDDAPPAPKKPKTIPGDVWVLGNHRVICGDSTDPGTYEAVLAGGLADLVWTDPPYGVAIVGGTKEKLTIANDEVDADKLRGLLDAAFTSTVAMTRPGACWYVAAPSGPHFAVFGALLTELGVWRQTIAWVKDSLVLGRADYHGRHESIFYGWTPGDSPAPVPPIDVEADLEVLGEGYDQLIYGWTPGAAHQRPPTRKQDTVWFCPRPKSNPDHPTMKPVDLINRAVRNSSSAGAVVLDPFGRSGSTLISCEVTGRHARLIELDPRYVDVICRRWQEATGRLPVSEASGNPHDFTAGR